MDKKHAVVREFAEQLAQQQGSEEITSQEQLNAAWSEFLNESTEDLGVENAHDRYTLKLWYRIPPSIVRIQKLARNR